MCFSFQRSSLPSRIVIKERDANKYTGRSAMQMYNHLYLNINAYWEMQSKIPVLLSTFPCSIQIQSESNLIMLIFLLDNVGGSTDELNDCT